MSVLLQHASSPFAFASGPALEESAPADGKASWETLLVQLKADFSIFGLDIVHPFALSTYNKAVAAGLVPGLPIPAGGASGDSALAILIGNTKNMWEPFLEACNCNGGELLDVPDPVDTYVERTVEACTKYVTGPSPYRVYWGHKDSQEGQRLPLQHVARTTGLAYLDEDLHLCLHPKFGPWFGLRAVLVFDGITFTGSQEAPVKNPLNSTTRGFVKLAVRSAQNSSSDNLASNDGKLCKEQVARRWRKWVAVREAPYPGHPWRYCNSQLEYHYTTNKTLLREAAEAAAPHN